MKDLKWTILGILKLLDWELFTILAWELLIIKLLAHGTWGGGIELESV